MVNRKGVWQFSYEFRNEKVFKKQNVKYSRPLILFLLKEKRKTDTMK